ncbi:uncharacterized protein LOC133731702 [Rosa rugosa]|uniref:uncharacterized protein LOC133731702 n=1 Tax=Rosa rugosa TaxID=74645 RepID=UPI002B417899|nr:uncharacterized protein LOC133731702 [Rosa rugosa]
MGIMNLPTIRRCSSVHNIVEEFIKKRYRKKLDMLTNEEDEQEEEYLQSRQVKRRIFPGVEAELAGLMMKLNLPCGQLEPIDHARFAVVCKEWQSLAKQYNCETQPWVKVLPPMLWIPTQSHGSDDPMAMLYSLSERKIYRNMKLPVPRDERIYCGYGWMAKYRYLNKSSDYYASLAITLMNPFRNAKDIIRLAPIQDSLFSVKQVVKITLPADPTLDRNNYVVLVICGSRLYFIRGGQKLWSPMHTRCSAATYYEGRVFSVRGFGRDIPGHELVSYRVDSSVDIYYSLHLQHVAWLEHCTLSHLLQTYFVTSTKGGLLVVERLLEEDRTNIFKRRKMLKFKVFKWVESIAQLAEVNDIGDEAIFVGNNQSVCVLASKFPGCQPNSIYYTNDLVVEGQRLEDIGIFNLEDGSNKTITHHYYPHKFVEGQMVPAIWITPSFPVC